MLEQELPAQLIRETRVGESTGSLGSSLEITWTQVMAVLGTITCKDIQHKPVPGNFPNVRGHPGDLHREWAEKQKT